MGVIGLLTLATSLFLFAESPRRRNPASAEGPGKAIPSSSALCAHASFNQCVPPVGERLGDRLRGLGKPWELACFLWIPAVVIGFTAWYELRSDSALGDFPIFRAASKAVVHGNSPYVAPSLHALGNFDTFVYPPAAAWVFAPLAVLPYSLAKV